MINVRRGGIAYSSVIIREWSNYIIIHSVYNIYLYSLSYKIASHQINQQREIKL